MSTVDTKAKALAQVKRFLETEKRIPQLPQILLRVETALEDPEIGGEELGGLLAQFWGLPTELVRVIGRHRPGRDWRYRLKINIRLKHLMSG